jgi:GT2 family glycosyltransferase
VGYFNSKNFPQIFMELDFCMRVTKAGYKIIVVPSSVVLNDRSDKNSDPIASRNFFLRFYWFLSSKKSALNFSQNKSLFKLLFKDSSINIITIFNILIFWVRYIIKILLFSTITKSQRVNIKKIINLDADFWA